MRFATSVRAAEQRLTELRTGRVRRTRELSRDERRLREVAELGAALHIGRFAQRR